MLDKKTLLIALAVILLVNSISYLFAASRRKGIVIRGINPTEIGKPTFFLVGGVGAKGSKAFDWILSKKILDGGITLIDYQNFGFNPFIAADQIRYYLTQNPRKAVFVSTSLGSEVVQLYVQADPVDPCYYHLMINPCLGGESVEKWAWMLTAILMPFARVVEFVLGWISFLPLIPANGGQGGWQSLTLMLDQYYWTIKSVGLNGEIAADGLIISTLDQVINNDYLDSRVTVDGPSCKREIHARHLDFAKFGEGYAKEVAYIIDCWKGEVEVTE